MALVRSIALFVSLSVAAVACARAPRNGPPQAHAPPVSVAGGEGAPVASPRAAATNVSRTVAGAPAGEGARPAVAVDDRTFGAATVLGNLAVYPVTSRSQVDFGPLVSLDDALAKRTAVIRERDDSGAVNQLVIENKGSVPIFVLAGTVVKGGKQDRQIGQDFIIEPKKTTPVDAFCVEQGRWNAQRDGKGTDGKFVSSGVVATSKVRAAGQYKKSQSEVWSSVSSTNTSMRKSSQSGTLMATIDDPAVAKERAVLAAQIDAALATVTPETDLVGVAYAIDGEVRGARWFSHHDVFELTKKKIVAGIALEAITARAEAKVAGRPGAAGPNASGRTPSPADVDKFVKDVEAAAVTEERDTAAANVNEYKESSQGFGSKTRMKGGYGKASSKPLSSDVVKK